MGIKGSLHCPVCRAKFRGQKECPRCQADLSMIMFLSARAQLYRQKARQALYALNFKKARNLAAAAQKAHATETGRRLLLLTSWLSAEL